tara:strand:+ start:10852 stop:11898 length:1047 start_codon:yes stop_codon:yes gene_type:complete
MARVSASERRKARNKRLSRVPIGGGQGNRIGKKRREKAAAAKKAAAEKAAAKKAADLAKNSAKNPAGTTVESQLKYFSNPENRKKLSDAVSLITGKKDSKPTSSSGGGTAPKINRGKVTSVNAFTQKDKKEKKSAKEELKESTKKAADALKSKASEKKQGTTPKSKVVGETKAGRRLERRIDRRARRRAFKTGAPMGSDQYKANVEAEKQLIRDRRGRRNQFLRNFASQLARGEQAKQPGKDYEGDYKEGDNFGQKGGSKENVAETAQTNENVEQNKEKLNTSSNDNSLMNTFLGTTNFAQKEFNILPEFDASKTNIDLTSSFNKGIATEDSTPQSAMIKLYNKKRGR